MNWVALVSHISNNFSTTKLAKCVGCGNTRIETLFSIEHSTLVKCPQCKLQFISPLPDQTSLDRIYANYYASWNLEQSSSAVSAMKKGTFQSFLECLPLPHDTTGNLLDVGCATGEMLTVAQSKGFDVYGVEISPQGKALCRELFGKDRILGKPLEHGDFPENYFDVITLCDVIEHIPDPPAFLNILADILKPHGLLMIITPDSASWTQKLLGKYWPHYKPEHLYYFNRSNLTLICSGRFEVIIADKAYKVLNLNYIAGILQGYARNRAKRMIGWIFSLLPSVLTHGNFKIHAGEMLMVLRKQC